MDDFGVLTERFGLKPQGKSAPMAASKLSTSSNSFPSHNSGSRTGLNGNSLSNSDFVDESFQKNTEFESYGGFDNYNGLLGSVNKSRKHSGNSGSDASSFDYDSIFFGSSNSDPASDDIFGSMPGFRSSVSTKKEVLPQSTQIDDLLGGFSRNVAKTTISKANGSKLASNTAAPFDGLIPGFEKSSSRINGVNTQQSTSHATKSIFSSVKDPFIELESTSIPPYTSSETFSDPLEEFSKFNNSGGIKLGDSSNSSSPFRVPPIPKPGSVPKMDKAKSSSFSTIDELEDFARGKAQNNNVEGKVNASTRKVNRDNKDADAAGISHQNTVDHLDSFFSAGLRSKSVPRSRATTPDSLFDIPKYNKPPEIPKGTSSAASSNIKKSSSAVNLVDDLSFVFEDASLFGEFQEVEGESEERRRARLGRQQRTQERAARAVADLNQRDFHTQHEQEEKRRIAESLAADIKRWAAGKEGNMRALLSTLQNILWSGCGWEPVSLTDMITSSSVKKVYRKAVLCIHPDKVQQRGANLEQKYTAEKVFDILKEAWNKFSKEEL